MAQHSDEPFMALTDQSPLVLRWMVANYEVIPAMPARYAAPLYVETPLNERLSQYDAYVVFDATDTFKGIWFRGAAGYCQFLLDYGE